MTIKVLPEPDIHISQEELERLQDEYQKAMAYYAGHRMSFEVWLRKRLQAGDEERQ